MEARQASYKMLLCQKHLQTHDLFGWGQFIGDLIVLAVQTHYNKIQIRLTRLLDEAFSVAVGEQFDLDYFEK